MFITGAGLAFGSISPASATQKEAASERCQTHTQKWEYWLQDVIHTVNFTTQVKVCKSGDKYTPRSKIAITQATSTPQGEIFENPQINKGEPEEIFGGEDGYRWTYPVEYTACAAWVGCIFKNTIRFNAEVSDWYEEGDYFNIYARTTSGDYTIRQVSG